MERHIALIIAALTLAAIGIAIMLPGGRQVDPEPKVPWRIEVNADGSVSVLGISLGHTTLSEVQALFEDEAELTLFVDKDGGISIEAYFERIVLSGLRADMVMTLDISDTDKQAMFDRGARMSTLGSGVKKVTLAPLDIVAAGHAPIQYITYLPVAELEPDLLEARFGAPAQLIPADRGVVHWLYPQLGLDIAVDPERREVFQYVLPKDFQRLVREPLELAAEAAQGDRIRN